MKGYQLTFFTLQSMKHAEQIVAEWLLAEAKHIGVSGATMNASQSSYGPDGRFHSVHFFELSEQPLEVLMVTTAEECEQLFAKIEEEKLELFYTKVAVEFGTTGKAD